MDAETQRLVDEVHKQLGAKDRPDDRTLERCAALRVAARSYGNLRRANANSLARGQIAAQSMDYGIPFSDSSDTAAAAKKVMSGRKALGQVQPAIRATARQISRLSVQLESLYGQFPNEVADAEISALKSCHDQLRDLDLRVSRSLANSGNLPTSAKEKGPTENQWVLLALHQELFRQRPVTADAAWCHLWKLSKIWRVSGSRDYASMRRMVLITKRKFPNFPINLFFLRQSDQPLFFASHSATAK